MRVGTYNVNGVGDQWDEDHAEEVAGFINESGVDIIGLQEPRIFQVMWMTNFLEDFYWFGFGRRDGEYKGEMCPVFFRKERFNDKDSGCFWLSENPDQAGSQSWGASLPRVATWGELEDTVTGKEFLLVNTHFDHESSEARVRSAELVCRVIDNDFDHDDVVLMGDLNSEANMLPHEFIRAGGFDEYSRATLNGTCYSRAFDYIYTRGLSIEDSWLHTEKEVRSLSDHVPVVAEVVY